MRRLYSTFAGGAPGIALLLMRLVVGAVVLWHAGPGLSNGRPLHMVGSVVRRGSADVEGGVLGEDVEQADIDV